MELFDIYSNGCNLDSNVPLRQPNPDDRAAKNTNTDKRMLVHFRGRWVPALDQYDFDRQVTLSKR